MMPEHIKEYCVEIDEKSAFYMIKQDYSDDFAYTYKIKCLCGCSIFEIFTDRHPTAEAVCTNCGKRITVYDLKYYPNAIKLSEDFEMKKYLSVETGQSKFEICALYEYSDEFDFNSEFFDRNDITGFSLFAFDETTSDIILVLDDETA